MILSVIIPVYNSSIYLDELFISLKKNNLENIELIFINDGSTDDSLNKIKKFSEICSIKLLNLDKNCGVSNARNIGIKNSTGKYLTFIDSDDTIGTNNFEIIKEIVSKQSFDYLTIKRVDTGISIIDFENEVYSNMDKYIEQYIYPSKHSFSVYDKIFLSEIVKQNDIFFEKNLKFSEDILFLIRYLKYVKNKCYFINQGAYYFRRIHNLSTIGKPVVNYFDKNIEYLQIIKKEDILGSKDMLLLSLITARTSLYRIYTNKDSKKIKYNISQEKLIFNNPFVKEGIKKGLFIPCTNIEKLAFYLCKKGYYILGYFLSKLLFEIRKRIS